MSSLMKWVLIPLYPPLAKGAWGILKGDEDGLLKEKTARGTKSPLRCAEVYDGDTTAYRRGKIRKVFQRGNAGKQKFPLALMSYSQTLICSILQ